MTDQPIQPARYVMGQVGPDMGHPHAPNSNTGSQCLACYGWVDDPRHLTMPTLATTGIGCRPAGRHA